MTVACLACLAWLGVLRGEPASGPAVPMCPVGRTALVLSGGGAAGLAHVGVIRVLDSLGIRPDWIVGSSMGAVVGAMYASGYTGRQLDSLVRRLPLDAVFGSRSPLPPPLDEWPFQIALDHADGRIRPESPFVRERELNLLLSAWLLEGNLQAAGDFDALPIPFRAVATDLERREPVALGTGDLAQAVRASIAVPFVLRPVSLNGRWLGDGSLTANIPVAIARSLGADRVIISDATRHLGDSLDFEAWVTMGQLMLSMLLTQPGDSLTAADVRVQPDVSRMGKFDFSASARASLIDRGYAAARHAVGAQPCTGPGPGSSGRRGVADPGVQVGVRDAAVLERATGVGKGGHVEVETLRAVLHRGNGGHLPYDALWLNPRATGDSLWLHVAADPRAPVTSALGAAYDADLGFQGAAGIVGLRAFRTDASVGVRAAVGRWRQHGDVVIRLAEIRRPAVRPVIVMSAAHEDVRRFGPGGLLLGTTETFDLAGFVGTEIDAGAGWVGRGGVTYAAWQDSAGGVVTAPGLQLSLVRPEAATGASGLGEVWWNEVFARVALDARWGLAIGRLTAQPGVRFGWGRALPLQHQFPLGGIDGFPGLQVGEHRGAREAALRLRLALRVLGPFHLTGETAAGAVGTDGGALPDAPWLFGARLGVGLFTPFGPIRMEYGRSSDADAALFLRVGRWF